MNTLADPHAARLGRLRNGRDWHGLLCRDYLHDIADRIQRDFGDQAFTTVVANSYSETSDRFSSIEVRTADYLNEPVKAHLDEDWFGITLVASRTVFGISTRAVTEEDARAETTHQLDRVHLHFAENGKLTIDQYAPAGYRLQWVFAVEDHRWYDEWRGDTGRPRRLCDPEGSL